MILTFPPTLAWALFISLVSGIVLCMAYLIYRGPK